MAFIETIGWIGAILLATCGIPQAYKSIKTKRFEGLSLVFIMWWGFGELFTLWYITERAFKWPLIFNYVINIIVVFIIIFLYMKYSKK